MMSISLLQSVCFCSVHRARRVWYFLLLLQLRLPAGRFLRSGFLGKREPLRCTITHWPVTSRSMLLPSRLGLLTTILAVITPIDYLTILLLQMVALDVLVALLLARDLSIIDCRAGDLVGANRY